MASTMELDLMRIVTLVYALALEGEVSSNAGYALSDFEPSRVHIQLHTASSQPG